MYLLTPFTHFTHPPPSASDNHQSALCTMSSTTYFKCPEYIPNHLINKEPEKSDQYSRERQSAHDSPLNAQILELSNKEFKAAIITSPHEAKTLQGLTSSRLSHISTNSLSCPITASNKHYIFELKLIWVGLLSPATKGADR